MPRGYIQAAAAKSVDIDIEPRLAAILRLRLHRWRLEKGGVREGERAERRESHLRHGGRGTNSFPQEARLDEQRIITSAIGYGSADHGRVGRSSVGTVTQRRGPAQQ